jgi:hypothetical protein
LRKELVSSPHWEYIVLVRAFFVILPERLEIQETDMLADLQGQIERITYTNDENGFTIAKLKVYGQRDLVTIVGNLMAPMPGEIINKGVKSAVDS